jgi:hypothetical protein
VERKFNVGDRVRIAWSSSANRIGLVATIASGLRPGKIGSGPWAGVLEEGHPGHELDIPGRQRDGTISKKPAFYPPEFLEPIYDGNEKVSWSECAWQPRSIKVC